MASQTIVILDMVSGADFNLSITFLIIVTVREMLIFRKKSIISAISEDVEEVVLGVVLVATDSRSHFT